MLQIIPFAAVLGLLVTSIHARALGHEVKREIAPAPEDVIAVENTADEKDLLFAYLAGLYLSESGDDPDAGANSVRLINFNGCNDDQKAQIFSGWAQSQKIMAVQSLRDGTVDFNTAGALEYLGAPALNKDKQSNMNDVFKNFASLTPAWWPFGWRIHVRCDDPKKKCTCGPSKTRAYTTNWDVDSELARINFCPKYFETPTLGSAIKEGKLLPDFLKYDMSRYWDTQGHVWAHEVLHIDWVAGAHNSKARYGDNEHVTDLIIEFTDTNGQARRTKAYEPKGAKILARWPWLTGQNVMRNADNLALFMTSQYVQGQLDNVYPHYPFVGVPQPDKPPYGTLFILNDDGSLTLNATDPDAALFPEASSDALCDFDEDEPDAEPLKIDALATNDQYPDEYAAMYDEWHQELDEDDGEGDGDDGDDGEDDGEDGDDEEVVPPSLPSCPGCDIN